MIVQNPVPILHPNKELFLSLSLSHFNGECDYLYRRIL